MVKHMKILTFSAAPQFAYSVKALQHVEQPCLLAWLCKKKTARERPFPYFFATPIKQAEPLYTLSN